MRVAVMGNSGAGKSTYARKLCSEHDIAHLDLDTIVWEPGEIAVARDESQILEDLDSFLGSNARWCIEGCYGNLISYVAPKSTLLVFLNPGVEKCLANNERRVWEPHKYSSLSEQNSMLEHLQQWVKDYYSRDDECSYKTHRELFDSFLGNKVEHHLTSPIG